MVIHNIPEDEWMAQLMPLLAGKARAAFTEVHPGAGYPEAKTVILGHFGVTPEASRICLREMTDISSKDPGDVVLKIKTLARRWLIPAEDPDETEGDQLRRVGGRCGEDR